MAGVAQGVVDLVEQQTALVAQQQAAIALGVQQGLAAQTAKQSVSTAIKSAAATPAGNTNTYLIIGGVAAVGLAAFFLLKK